VIIKGLLFGLGWALASAIVGAFVALIAWLFERFERWRWRRL
jgi:hypothetical protein